MKRPLINRAVRREGRGRFRAVSGSSNCHRLVTPLLRGGRQGQPNTNSQQASQLCDNFMRASKLQSGKRQFQTCAGESLAWHKIACLPDRACNLRRSQIYLSRPMEKVVIIGSGRAGWTAALYTARAQLAPLVLTGKQPGGLLTTTSIVENFPGFPEGVDGYELMTRMQKQAERFGAKTSFGVGRVSGFFQTARSRSTVDGEKVEAETVIIATGASHKHLGVPGEDLLETKGVTYCATCDGALPVFRNQPLVVVGGGDSACEEALYLTRFGSVVHLVHRRDSLRASKIMADRTLAQSEDQTHLGFRRDGNSRREAGQCDRREIEKSQDRRGMRFGLRRGVHRHRPCAEHGYCSKAKSRRTQTVSSFRKKAR